MRQTASIEIIVAWVVVYVALGGAIFALAAGFCLLGDEVGLFFAPLIPRMTASLRTIQRLGGAKSSSGAPDDSPASEEKGPAVNLLIDQARNLGSA